MLRVLTLSTLFPDAGRPTFGIFVERQTRELAAIPDVDLRVVAPIGLPPWPASRLPRFRRLAALPRQEQRNSLVVSRPQFVTLPGTGGRFHVAALVAALEPVLDAIRGDFAFDVIDTEFFFPDGPAAVALGRRYGVPVSIKARGADIHHWGHGATADQVRRAGQCTGGMLAVSDALKHDMATLGLPADRIRVHRTGVDLDRFRPADRHHLRERLGAPAPLIVAVGALIPRKAHDILIEALAALPAATLWIAGEGPERPRLERLIARRGLADRVRLLGTVAHDALPDLYGAADVTALASSSEGLANAWVESLACGTPVVIPDVGGARELVTTSAAGRVVARTPGAFAVAIGALLDAPPPPDAIRAAALPFTWQANAATLRAHLLDLTRAGPSTSREKTL